MATGKEKLDNLARYVGYRIKAYAKKVEDYTSDMNEDFEYFFRWCSEDMYKTQLLLKHYRKMEKIVVGGDVEKALCFMKGEVARIEEHLLHRPLRMASSSQAANIAFVLELEVGQFIRQEYLEFIRGLEQ